MKKTGARIVKDWIFENGSYKLVALFVTLILWVTILGRRDFVLSKEMDVQFMMPAGLTISRTDIAQRITVKVSGPRMALKKFAQDPGTITVDLMNSRSGKVEAVITPPSVKVPFGLKVLSVNPDVIQVTLVPSKEDEARATQEDAAKNANGDSGEPSRESKTGGSRARERN